MSNVFTLQQKMHNYFSAEIFDAIKYTKKACIGIAYTTFTIFTLGLIQSENISKNITKIFYADKILPTLYLSALKKINPSIKIPSKDDYTSKDKKYLVGTLTQRIAYPIMDQGFAYAKKDSVLLKHGVSRALYLIGAASVLVTRTADLALGILGTVACLASLGKKKKINQFAIRNLNILGVIPEVMLALNHLLVYQDK